jgi:hypothetical protein
MGNVLAFWLLDGFLGSQKKRDGSRVVGFFLLLLETGWLGFLEKRLLVKEG